MGSAGSATSIAIAAVGVGLSLVAVILTWLVARQALERERQSAAERLQQQEQLITFFSDVMLRRPVRTAGDSEASEEGYDDYERWLREEEHVYDEIAELAKRSAMRQAGQHA
ncbi:hypothetical protein ADL15_34240 [Actinoplanes awajinensis subsp. mycoplanecinus]|uniref:Uncharacterized protein n=2 Tax=Actinoplanes awajinensis TaxID=135946 RepID=A0A101JK50_9ACTN|nr:hypothetical protein ADL15_34240 [Actinoplanes awajinensis subsp. mycoplanecinus]